MNKYCYFLLFSLVAYQLFTSCASPTSPTGGPKDTIPPTLLHSIPLKQTINFTDQSITLIFDERIKTAKLKEQLIITPLTTSKYEFTIKKNIFKITFEEPFNDNTTYTLNFRESIQDLTESNPTRDNKLTFSTGNYIDSLSVEGYVKELLTYDTLESVFVGLYNAEDTITIYNGSPYYFAEADEKGKYLIENIKNGNYLIYAFKDENKNLKLETNKEAYAFKKDTLHLDSLTTTINLDLIKLDLTELKMMSALASGKYFEINFNKYIDDYNVQPVLENHTLYTSKSKENKSIRFYNNFTNMDSLQVSFEAKDSIHNTVTDTLYVKFTESRRKTDDFTMQLTPANRSSVNANFTTNLTFNKPILAYNTDSIFMRYDTTKIFQVNDSTLRWSKHKNELSFDVMINKVLIDTLNAQKQRMLASINDTTQILEEQQNIKRQASSKDAPKEPKINQGLQIYIGNGAFISADNDTSVAFGNNYKIIDPTNFGTQEVVANTQYKSFTVQLLKENFEVVREYRNDKNHIIKNIEPGKYIIRILIDTNEDGKWSPGNMIEQIEPEPVYIYPDVIVIRADWETSVTLSF